MAMLTPVIFDRNSLKPKLDELAGHNVLIGTSSWKYEGWLGPLYDPQRYLHHGRVAKSRFEAGCLEEYAETFPTVCVDAGFYRFPAESYVAKLAGLVPDGFRLSFKATDEVTVRRFPRQPRHGDRAGKFNENFLNASLFANAFLGPLSAHRSKIGVIMFEFSRFHPGDFERGRDFVAALDGFLSALPKEGWQYGVELRNSGFLKPEYFEALARNNVAHVFNAWTRMPEVSEQLRMEGAFTTDFFAARFLLRKGRSYQAAVDAFSPYERMQDPNPEGRAAMKMLTEKKTARPSYIFVNNRFEGSALGTIAAVVGQKPRV
jgi:uncharacterized protein YecE (DUF72 family)